MIQFVAISAAQHRRLKLKGNEIAAGELRRVATAVNLDEEMRDLNGYLTTELLLVCGYLVGAEKGKAEISVTVVDATVDNPSDRNN